MGTFFIERVAGKRVQQFPDDWQLAGNVSQQYRQIGNAVPGGLGKVLGEAIVEAARHGYTERDPDMEHYNRE
jgi:DNA (cytosine-5)-methyltransferase 1